MKKHGSNLVPSDSLGQNGKSQEVSWCLKRVFMLKNKILRWYGGIRPPGLSRVNDCVDDAHEGFFQNTNSTQRN